jgi:glycosyltransferase involved in cell wall biosynthesis
MSNKLLSAFDSKTKKRISFVLATKQRAKFLDKTLERVKLLKGKNDEVIVIDGNSTDDTPKILRKYSKIIDKAISEPDESEGHAFNKGILLSTGKYIKLLTDDDVIYSDALEKAIKILDSNREIDVLLCGGIRKLNGREEYVYVPSGAHYGKKVDDVFIYGGCGIGLIIRRSGFSKTGILNARAVMLDRDYITQAIYSNACVRFCRIKLFYHPIEAHSGLNTKLQALRDDKLKIKKRYNLIRLDAVTNRWVDTYTVFDKNSLNEKNVIWDGGFS